MPNETSNTLPLPPNSYPPSVYTSFVSSPNTRGTTDLIWSCLLTIFLCTWSIQRLEVPSPKTTAWHSFRYKLFMAALTVIAPEAVCLLAGEEWLGAHMQVRRFHDYGFPWWTTKHALFSYMGGYSLDFGDGKTTIVMEDQIIYLIERNLIVLDRIRKSDIANLAKIDILTQTITCVQLAWFVLQCIGRLAQHLPFSLLEVTTVAFITESAFIIFFWWHKPGDVCWRVRLEAPNFDKDTVEQMFHATEYSGIPGTNAAMLKNMRIPLWHVSKHLSRGVIRLLIMGVISVSTFSAWHLAAWHFAFPTITEKILWRICTIFTFILPFAFVSIQSFVWTRFRFFYGFKHFAGSVLSHRPSMASIGAVLYGIARLYLIVEVFISLRYIPVGVYDNVQWSNYIPHF